MVEDETVVHILSCNDAGCMEAFHMMTDCLDDWMDNHNTDTDLAD